MRTGVAVYAVAVGVAMVGWWTIDLRRGAWDRSERTHGELALHLIAELATAGLLVAAGILRLAAGAAGDRFLGVGLGMLLYTTIASPGYFLARRELPVVWLFAALVVLTIGALIVELA